MPSHPMLRAALAAAALILLLQSGAGPTLAAEEQTVEIVTRGGVHTFTVEFAETDEERTRGLMFRKELPEGRGMMFDFIHMVTFMSCLKSNIMPRPSGSSLRNMRPRVRSSSVSANSTENVWTPPRVTISTVCSSAAKVGPAPD